MTLPAGFTPGSLDAEGRIKNAEALCAYVRGMAVDRNVPTTGTVLHEITTAGGRTSALCNDFTNALIALLATYKVRLVNTSVTMRFCQETHVLVTAKDPRTQTWFLLDPSFGITPYRISGGARVRAEEIRDAVRAMEFDAIGYRALTPAGYWYLHDYYVDYPLLYLNLSQGLQPFDNVPVLDYLTEQTWPRANLQAAYLVGSATGSAVIRRDGVQETVQCNGVGNLSAVMLASTMEAVTMPTTYHLYTPNRYSF